MKKTILSLAFTSLLFCSASALILVSCQDKTKEKFEEAKDALTNEVKTKIDSAKIKAEAKYDTLKKKTNAKIDSAKIKSAEKMEAAAQKLKDAVNK